MLMHVQHTCKEDKNTPQHGVPHGMCMGGSGTIMSSCSAHQGMCMTERGTYMLPQACISSLSPCRSHRKADHSYCNSAVEKEKNSKC